jgi:hypothetical protein
MGRNCLHRALQSGKGWGDKIWDEVFGRPTRYGTLERLKRDIEAQRLVSAAIERPQAEGKPLSQVLFQERGEDSSRVKCVPC